MAVQTTYGALLPPDMMHSCSDMSTTLMLSDARISSSLGSGSLGFACDDCPPMDCADSDAQTLLFGSFDEEQEQARCHTLPSACLSELFQVLRYERMVFIFLGVLFAMLHTALCLCNAAWSQKFGVRAFCNESSANKLSGPWQLQDAEDKWETVPVKSKGRKHAADSSAASSPTNPPHGKLAKADSIDSDDDSPHAPALQSVQQQLPEVAPHSEAGKAASAHLSAYFHLHCVSLTVCSCSECVLIWLVRLLTLHDTSQVSAQGCCFDNRVICGKGSAVLLEK